ncbi:MAG TPA: polyprenol monophosphomannose synthase [Thermomicrobiaceae bacterium]|nr:polyprenol monophosphomannose synthase [Thermomicrobiaceae bacterium]
MSDEPLRRRQNRKTLVILPTYNERANVATLLPAILRHPDVDVLVVDDNSPDGTSELVLAFGENHPSRIFLLNRPSKLGLGTAYVAGFRWALRHDYDLVCEMDADFSHDPASLPALIAAAQEADLALGSRYVAGGGTTNWSLLREMISRSGSLYARAILNLPYHDLTGGFKCFRRTVLESLDLGSLHSTGYAFQIELTYRVHQAGYTVREVPITFDERRNGKSKMSSRIVLEALVRVAQLRFSSRKGISVSPAASTPEPSFASRPSRPQ